VVVFYGEGGLKLRLSREISFQDNGKPIWEARMDMETVIGAFEYFGGIAPTIVG
jgi:hypothetical protein